MDLRGIFGRVWRIFGGIFGRFLEGMLRCFEEVFRGNITYTILYTNLTNPDIFLYNHTFPYILTWTCDCRPGNKTIYVVFDVESDFSGPRT